MPSPWGSRYPGAKVPAPFTGARRRLVAWNIGILCAILLVVAAFPRVRGDAERLHQLLLILLDNALRYTPRGGAVRLDCWHEPVARAPGAAVLIEVTDTGPGIGPEHLPRLFDRFYRVDKARSRELGGSGLGLAIADGIARAHGGVLTVRSELGAGTTFRLALPAA